jgi:hypothetical protein
MPLVSRNTLAEKTTCRREPCAGEGPRSSARPEPASPQGEELEFLDDTEHALLPALRRAGGWIEVVSPGDRSRALALYRVSDGKNLGAGTDLASFPLRVVVHEPESYLEIERWLAAFGAASKSLRTVAIFPPQTQQHLHN